MKQFWQYIVLLPKEYSMTSFEHNQSVLLLRPILFITAVLLIVSLSLSTATARDTITPTQPLADNETLVSAGGTFALGFFTPNNSDRRYIGIWYYNTTYNPKTIVWVANRANPVIGSTGQLSVTANGTVTITNRETSAVVWSVVTNFIGLTKPVAELLDTGNFVVKEEHDNPQQYFSWQSFDLPTDTLLPGMKLGFDKVAGLNRSLTAWRSEDDPSPGEYHAAMVIEPIPEMYLFDGSAGKKVWRSGPWDGRQLGGIPITRTYPGGEVTYSFVNNYTGVMFSYEASYHNISYQQQTVPPLLQVTPSGHLLELGWSFYWRKLWEAPGSPCDDIGQCGSYGICDSRKSPICSCLQGFAPKNPANWGVGDYADGCVRSVGLDCGSEGNGTFLSVYGVKLPESSSSWVNATSTNEYECRSECLENCSCNAYSISEGGGGCVIWVTDLFDVVQLFRAGQDLYIRINGSADDAGTQSDDAAASHSQSPMAKRTTIVAIVVSLLSGALLLSCFIFFLRRRKKRQRVILGRTNFFSDKLDEDDRGKDPDLPLFTFGTIAAATESFSDENKLGQGGFGPVYKGTLGGDKVIAVKRLAKSSQQGAEEFKNEVILIAKLQNRNLVRLLGCCIHGEERMLVYEYMPNKSLDAFLFEKEKAVLLEWQTRYQIIVGITRGLLYLHHDSRYRIIHRDLKASNILLDKEMNPKISDFGLARLFGGDATGYNTKKVVGTYGYMSPEYAMEGIFSLKSDVYSFGVLLLEIISGRKNRGSYAFSQHLNLVAHTWSLWNEGKSLDLVDEAMNSNFPKNDVLKCIKIGLLCVQDHPEDRPLMSSVIEMLGADITSLRQPKQPTFLARMDLELGHVSNRKDSRTSNELTVTLDGR
ncbi:G-type lectin S-receptor-like serine/threonine-protein kinase [Iris pallida]|uniref:Receptor-like serine/threonine-protein kinase n=1 Tax=Iris pallida TaxID=29817 RepID=A0AAX6HSZ5_IRIPA|nr:G-type lectin S-receptor-like serine/threonine-protein kinase [Iris pallida]